MFAPALPLQATLSENIFDCAFLRGMPEVESPAKPLATGFRRRDLLLAAASAFASARAVASDAPLVFSPNDSEQPTAQPEAAPPQEVGFWEQPRELWLRRHGRKEEVRVVYWRDGKLVPEGYWQACALLRDVSANKMTTMDPAVLDVLRGIHGYYEQWKWRHPIVITSGYRTSKTNNKQEGAAKNSMHLYGKAVDLYVPGIPVDHIRRLGLYLQQGGVGYYPDNGFTHLDTGRLRTWRG